MILLDDAGLLYDYEIEFSGAYSKRVVASRQSWQLTNSCGLVGSAHCCLTLHIGTSKYAASGVLVSVVPLKVQCLVKHVLL